MLPCVFSPAQCTPLFLTLQGSSSWTRLCVEAQMEDRFLRRYLNENLLSVTQYLLPLCSEL